jgi:hypothetical protein
MALFVATFTFFESGTGVAGQRASCWRSSLVVKTDSSLVV